MSTDAKVKLANLDCLLLTRLVRSCNGNDTVDTGSVVSLLNRVCSANLNKI